MRCRGRVGLEQLCRYLTRPALSLLKRVFDNDMQHCPNYGCAEFKIIAAILERQVIEKVLTHLGLDPQPPARYRAREAGHDFAT